MYYEWRRRTTIGEFRATGVRESARLAKQGQVLSPVRIEGRKIAQTFWGKAWCDNLERYGDFANRLPRGRTYVRRGAVLDLQVAPGEVRGQVSGSALYQVTVQIGAVAAEPWRAICQDCTGAIDSLVELLRGRFSQPVMERLCRVGTGLFPTPGELKFECTCPDWASMCKHVAAVLYGVGARLDHAPELLFKLRGVDAKDLIAGATTSALPEAGGAGAANRLEGAALGEMFGIELAASAAESKPEAQEPPAPRRTVTPRAQKKKPAVPAATGKLRAASIKSVAKKPKATRTTGKSGGKRSAPRRAAKPSQR